MRTTCMAWLILASALLVATPSRADFQDGVDAYKADDYAGAFRNWKPLAELGDRDAQLGLGSLYERGRGTDPDPVEALKWYTLAWEREVYGAKRRALALRATLDAKQLEASTERIQAWKKAFADRSTPPPTSVRGDIREFRAGADLRTRSNTENTRLRILCQARGKEGYVTFVTADGKHVLLVALTAQPLVDPSKDIFLDWKVWVRQPGPGQPVASLVGSDPRRPTATMDWAYVYDRNGDGFVDYFTYLDGPNPILPNPPPRVVPRSRRLSEQQMQLMTRHTHMLFWHAADDNYDGQVDGFAVGTRNDDSGWIDGHIVVRSTNFDGRFSDCRFVPLVPGAATPACRAMELGYGVPGRTTTGLEIVPPGFDWFLPIHVAARKCGLTARHFRSE